MTAGFSMRGFLSCAHICWRWMKMMLCKVTPEVIFTPRFFFRLVIFSQTVRGDCQGHKPSVSHLSWEFKTSYMTCRSSACSTAARNPREITISFAFVCREPSCIKNRTLHSGLSSCFTVHQFVFKRASVGLVTCSYSASQWSIYDASFCFLIRHTHPSQFILESTLCCHVRV